VELSGFAAGELQYHTDQPHTGAGFIVGIRPELVQLAATESQARASRARVHGCPIERDRVGRVVIIGKKIVRIGGRRNVKNQFRLIFLAAKAVTQFV